MDKMEAYCYLFADSFMNALVITPHDSFVFYTMKIFGTYNQNLMLLIATLASIAAIVLNWGFGYILRYCEKTEYVTTRNELYLKIKKYFHILSYILLCISFVPVIGPIITTLCGLFRISIIRTILISGVSYLISYYLVLMQPGIL